MGDQIERACTNCGSLLHHEDDCIQNTGTIIFNIEHQYQKFLGLMALQEEEMHPAQKVQLRQAFFGAAGQLLILFRDNLSQLDEDKAVTTLEGMLNEVQNYWLTQTGQQN